MSLSDGAKQYTPPVYQNNPTLQNFKQTEEGFGFSNFRIQSQPTLDIPTKSFTEYLDERSNHLTFQTHHQDYHLTEPNQVTDDYVYWDIIKNFQERNPLIDSFFSRRNLNHLQNLLIQMIHHKSNGQYMISRQSDPELLTIMRSIYIKTATNPHSQGKQLRNEICKLNKNVLDWAVPRIFGNIQQYIGYARDRENKIIPQSYPQYTSSAGTKINHGFDHFI